MKKILGLDLGTNSIGWAVINSNITQEGNELLDGISSAGSRIIPMDAAALSDFDKGTSQSQTKERTRLRGGRRLLERYLLRRERLLRVLALMGFLPKHFEQSLDRYGKFISDSEPRIAWIKNETGGFEFLFKDSFQEMLVDFRFNSQKLSGNDKKIPYDWTLYYLRKKALHSRISKEELSWVLLNFNQKRGYNQLRGEEEPEDDRKCVKYYILKVVSVEDSGDRKGKDIWYNVILENGWVYRRASSVPLDWVGKTKEFIVTTELDDNGNPKLDKNGEVKRSFRAPKEEDWGLVKIRTQELIDKSGKTVGEYIYDSLLSNPSQKIKGKLVQAIDRRYYKDELFRILEKQKDFHPELNDKSLLSECVYELYRHNDIHRNILCDRGFTNFILEDILFYQRPLKSKKSLIEDCPYESRVYKKDGILCREPLKCVSKSHPLFQEFRLWQFVSNLRIYKREAVIDGSLKTDVDVTGNFLAKEEDYVMLFDWLNERKNIDQKAFLSYKAFGLNKKEQSEFRWNYVEDKSYPCNETRADILSRLTKCNISQDFLSVDKEMDLWHILYSISDRTELGKALKSFALKNGLNEGFSEVFIKMPPFEKNYASYSLKAIKKLLPLMRMGRYWNQDAIDCNTKMRIEKIINGEYDETIRNRVRDKSIHLTDIAYFKGLPLWLACYVVYDRHSESGEIEKWNTPSDIDSYLHKFKQHSLRNPVVEQVIMETLRIVRDIWQKEGYIDEIHVELGREMKTPSKERARLTEQVLENENTNLRIKALLTEFINPEFNIEGVRPGSPSQQEILRIYEEGVLSNKENEDLPEDIVLILKKFKESDIQKRPTKSEVLRYKLWLEQRYRSPYTGRVIPLAKLFTPMYQIEHIIPKARYFDDSYSNKVICEAAVNRIKDKMLGYEFIKKNPGLIVDLGNGETAKVLDVHEYEKLVKDSYYKNKKKLKNLLLEDIPDDFIERQLNDSRYISKVVKTLLSNIVREKDEQETVSKNVIVCTGSITDRLKKDWGVNDVWNRIILPRFIRMNRLTESSDYTAVSQSGHVIPTVPLCQLKGFNKKRIDHRHHAMDAIVIACVSRNIVNYLNNSSACKGAKISRYDLQHILCDKVKTDDNGNYSWFIRKPWETFTQDVYVALENIVVSFKQNVRVINRTSNKYQHYNEYGKKVVVHQAKGDAWAIRKSMHKDTVYGEINLRIKKELPLKEAIKDVGSIVERSLKAKLKELLELHYDIKAINKYFDDNKDVWCDINLKRIPVYCYSKDLGERFFATRKPLDTSFTKKKIENEISDTAIQKILLRHLAANGNNPEWAFSPDGIERLNNNIIELNDGKFHQPVLKVRLYERAERFAVGQKGNKKSKFVEAAKGSNLFFAVYETLDTDKKTGETIRKRTYSSIPLNVAIDRQKKGLLSAPEDINGNVPAFVLSPNSLIYLLTNEELQTGEVRGKLDISRIYKVVSFTGNRLFVIPYSVASTIKDKCEYSIINKIELTDDKVSIKEYCVPLNVDRLGNVKLDYTFKFNI